MGRSRRAKSTGSYKEMESLHPNGCTTSSYASSQIDQRQIQDATTLLRALSRIRDASGRPLIHDNSNLALSSALLIRLRQLEYHSSEGTSSKNMEGNRELLRREWMLATDEESGYSPLHWAIYKGQLAKILLLLRDGMADGNSTVDSVGYAPPRLKQRPMLVLNGDASTCVPPLMTEMANLLDKEGKTPGQLLGALQREELRQCRIQAVYKPKLGRAGTDRRSRRNTFEDLSSEEYEQDDLAGLGRAMRNLDPSLFHVQDTLEEDSNNNNDDNDTEYGCELFTFGRAHHCALGVGQDAADSERKLRPQRVQEFGGRRGRAVAVAGAAHHTLVVTAEGHLYAFGLGKGGRLGTGDDSHCPVPRRVRGPLANKHVVSVAAAENHSLCVTRCGEVYSFGSNRFGQLGTSTSLEDSSRCLPRRVDDLANTRCIAVAAGARHSVALSASGEVYVWGDNSAGQLGIVRRNGPQKVQRVEALWGTSKVALSISASDQSTLVLTSPVSGGLRVNSVYEFGHGSHAPTRVQFGSDARPADCGILAFGSNRVHRDGILINPVAIASARHHNVAITSDGHVYSWGLHSEALGNGSSTKSRKGNSSSTSPQLVTGMLPENGGGVAVAVSASDNHTAVITESGHLYTWGATSPQNVLGHHGVRWQPNPKRVPGVSRAVGVSAAKEHMAILIGTTYPPIAKVPKSAVPSLESLASHEIAKHVDLFNVLPILLTSERTGSTALAAYCNDFVRRNLDGVLNVSQKSVMDTYLNEHILGHELHRAKPDSHEDQDASLHPLLSDTITTCNPEQAPSIDRTTLSNFNEWVNGCSELLKTAEAKLLVKRWLASSPEPDDGPNTTFRKSRSMSDASGRYENESTATNRCLELVSNMDLSTVAFAEGKLTSITKELRSTRKKLAQIQKLRTQSDNATVERSSLLSDEQREKIARRPQLEADLRLLEPALEDVERRLRQLRQIKTQKETTKKPDEDNEKKETLKDSSDGPTETGEGNTAATLRCTLCNIKCPDQKSYELHMNGRKHRNRVAQAEDEEKKNVAAKIAIDKLSQQMFKSSVSESTTCTVKKGSTKSWKEASPAPKFKLPGPPHPVPDSVVSVASRGPSQTASSTQRKEGRMSLMDIMHEEETRSKTTLNSKRSAQVSPLSKPMQPKNSPSWGKDRKDTGQQGKASPMLAHFLAPQEKTPTKVTLASSVWASETPVKKALISPIQLRAQSKPKAAPGMSLLEIQKQEEHLKAQADRTSYSGSSPSNWFVERRARAGSFQELQKREEQEREERLLIEEQFRIERMIREEQKAIETANKSKKNGGRKKGAPQPKGQQTDQKKRRPKTPSKGKPKGGKKTAPKVATAAS